MKMGRPEYHIPLPETVSHDVRNVFVNIRKCIMKMLQVSNARDQFLKTTHFVTGGTPRYAELCDKLMDVSKPQGVCCHHCSF